MQVIIIIISCTKLHRDALRIQKKNLKSGAAAVTFKQWKFQKQMQVLAPYTSNRPREGDLELDSEDDDPPLESVETEDFESEEVTTVIPNGDEQIKNEKNAVMEPAMPGTCGQQNHEKQKVT